MQRSRCCMCDSANHAVACAKKLQAMCSNGVDCARAAPAWSWHTPHAAGDSRGCQPAGCPGTLTAHGLSRSSSAKTAETCVHNAEQWNNYLCGLQLARDGGATVILDCGGADAAISQELLPLLSVLSPNETELARLTGARGSRHSDCLDISNNKSPARAHLINWHHASIGSHW